MTQTVRRGRVGAVYGIPCWAVDRHGTPIVGQVVVGYIGKSRQTVKQREEQHRLLQPFSDVIVGGSWTIEEGWWTDAELDEREQYYIEHGVVLAHGQAPQRPVYNYEHNLGNPDRIEIWRAIEQRQRREPGWQPPPKGDRIPRPRPRPHPRPVRKAAQPSRPSRRAAVAKPWLARWWDNNQWLVVGLTGVWLVFFLAALWLAWSAWSELRPDFAAGLASAPFVAAFGARVRRWWLRETRRCRRSGRRR